MHILHAHAQAAQAGTGSRFELRYSFSVDSLPAGPVFIALESPRRFSIQVNGQPVSNEPQGWWVDIAFEKVEITGSLRPGGNEIVLAGSFSRDTELESVYLIGAIGVSARRLKKESSYNGQVFDRYAPEFQLTALPVEISAKPVSDGIALDLTAQGFSFFAGRLRLSQEVELSAGMTQVALELENLRAAVAHVFVNGQAAGTLAWPPHRLDISGLARPGNNRIELELVGTLRNLLGPHHISGGDSAWTGPETFRDQRRWTADYILAPFGFRAARLLVA
jgi:hypothetical protein